MRRLRRWVMVAVLAGMPAGCGVPREALGLAGREQALLAAAGSEEQVRTALAAQADAWDAMAALAGRHDFGGMPAGGDFAALVEQAAALARRQRALIESGQDTPAENRRALEAMRKLWGDVQTYFGR